MFVYDICYTGGFPMSQNPNNPSLLKEALSLLLDFVPFVGSGKSALEVVAGKDVITGEHINRWIAGGGIILGMVPFGKILGKGRKSSEMAEKIAAKIVYDANSKKELLKKMEKVIPTATREVDQGFILQEISSKVKPDELAKKYGINFNPLDSRSDMNLIHQYLVQMRYGGHAVYKHWLSGGKKELLHQLSEVEKKKVQSQLSDAEEVFAYLKMVLKDPKTVRLDLPTKGRIGFANPDKKVIIIHNPVEQGTFWHHKDPIQALEKIFKEESKR